MRRRTPTRTDRSGERMTERMDVSGPDRVHLSELVEAVVEAIGPTDMHEVIVHSAFLSWERPSRVEEMQEWLAYERDAAKRLEKWERETYERLKGKFSEQ